MMDLGQILRKKARLEQEHKDWNVKDMLAVSRGHITDEELQTRYDARLTEIAELDSGAEAFKTAVEREKRKEALRKLRIRWKRFTEGVWHSKPHKEDPIDYTKAGRAVLVAFMFASEGNRRFMVAFDWIAKKCGASRSTVRRTLKEMQAEGLIDIEQNKIEADRNEWNTYTILSDSLAAWAKRKFKTVKSETGPAPKPVSEELKTSNDVILGEGVKTDLHYSNRTCSNATPEDKSEELVESVTQINTQSHCRSKALRLDGAKLPESISSESFELIAKASLSYLGYETIDGETITELQARIDIIRENLQPDFAPFIWERWGLQKHGRRKTQIAFLNTRMMKNMRKTDIPDDRPQNEREPIRNANGYLASILKLDSHSCRPEVSVASILLSKQIYDLPTELVRLVRARNRKRAKLKRSDHSGLIA